MALSELDRKLRTLVHDAIERVEATLRSHLSDVIGSVRPLAYRDATTEPAESVLSRILTGPSLLEVFTARKETTASLQDSCTSVALAFDRVFS
ncbi:MULTISPECIES: Abi family protein [unclassified Microbacterium]|uniref:Abi family protein n=1 Tax=unclassified Microbacterium TaxID=2609290 RepID=UPI00301A5BF5